MWLFDTIIILKLKLTVLYVSQLIKEPEDRTALSIQKNHQLRLILFIKLKHKIISLKKYLFSDFPVLQLFIVTYTYIILTYKLFVWNLILIIFADNLNA